MPGTKFDKYWVDSIQRKVPTIDRVVPFIEFLEKQEVGVECVKAFIPFQEDYFSTDA